MYQLDRATIRAALPRWGRGASRQSSCTGFPAVPTQVKAESSGGLMGSVELQQRQQQRSTHPVHKVGCILSFKGRDSNSSHLLPTRIDPVRAYTTNERLNPHLGMVVCSLYPLWLVENAIFTHRLQETNLRKTPAVISYGMLPRASSWLSPPPPWSCMAQARQTHGQQQVGSDIKLLSHIRAGNAPAFLLLTFRSMAPPSTSALPPRAHPHSSSSRFLTFRRSPPPD